MGKTSIILSAITICLWGMWGFFGKLAITKGMPPIGVFIAEILMSVVVVAGVVIYAEDRHSSFGPWHFYGFLSGLGLSVGLLSYYFLLQREKASVVIPFTASYPLIAVLLSVFILGERLRPIQWIGVVVVVMGLVMLLSSGSTEQHE